MRDKQKERHNAELRRLERKSWRQVSAVILFIIAGICSALAFPSSTWSEVHTLHSARSVQQHAQPARPRSREQVVTQIDALLTQMASNQQFSGSVLVAQGGNILLAKGYSLANWDTGTLNLPETRFYLGSLTKAFTAMAILMLQEQGKLHVQDALCTYIPNCPPPWKPISIQQVLTHTSGIPQLNDSQLSNASPAAWIASFSNAPLQFMPGNEFQYCSICYQILGYVVQQVSGVPYTQFIQQMILGPLQMNETGFDVNAYYTPGVGAQGYESWQVKAPRIGFQAAPQWSFLFGSGLLYSTINDLYRWDQALYTTKLVSQQTLDQIFTPYVNATLFPGSTYGYGWFITQAPVQNHRLIWHDGVIDGFRNFIGRYVDDDVTVIVLSNLTTLDAITLGQSIGQMVFK